VSHFRVLVPTTNPGRTGPLLKAISPFLSAEDSRGTLLGVIEMAPERPLSEGVEVARAYRALLSRTTRYAQRGPGELRGQVRIAHVAAQGIREAVLETDTNLLVLAASTGRGDTQDGLWVNAVEDLLVDPPCDVALVRPDTAPVRSVLVPVRGGPSAELALRLASTVCKETGAQLNALHVFNPRISTESREREEAAFLKLASAVDVPVRRLTVFSTSVREAIIREAAQHQLVVLGATLSLMHRPMVLGAPVSRLLRRLTNSVMVVKTAGPPMKEPDGFRVESRAAAAERVDRWFAENTFHSREFAALKRLVDLKQRQGLTISLGLPTLNEQTTIGKVVRTFKHALMEKIPLVDEIVVIDSGSSDRTVSIAQRAGVAVVQHSDILPRYGVFQGKGEALWKSLYTLRGDLICWVDTDITNIHPKFVYGLLGPLLSDPEIHYVKGFYRRPLQFGAELHAQGGGRVTELAARPLLNLFFPELSGLVQPLSGEYAGRRRVLESVPFFTGYGVELGLLLAISEAYGLRAIAQVDLGMRLHRNQTLFELSKMAFAIIQVGLKHLGDRHRIHLLEEVNKTMKLIHYEDERYWIEQKEIEDQERPPMNSVPEYFLARHRASTAGG
jgi:nucleotide-binding universal stress UspA family protein